jgi:GT2 family glycosyltransferase
MAMPSRPGGDAPPWHASPPVDVLIPTYRRPAALAVTLATLVGQTHRPLRIVVSSQSPEDEPVLGAEAEAVRRVLEAQGRTVEVGRHLPRRGMAEHRQHLLDRAVAPYALFLDDDIVLEPDCVARMLRALRDADCGFVGCAPIGLSYSRDERPDEQAVEFWDGPVEPERVTPGSTAWARHRLHNAANLHHLRHRLGESDRLYHVAWVGACVLFDTARLRAAGGFGFWDALPPDAVGEDVVAQLRVMGRFGGAGLFPSGAYHQEVPTTIAERHVDAPHLLPTAP